MLGPGVLRAYVVAVPLRSLGVATFNQGVGGSIPPRLTTPHLAFGARGSTVSGKQTKSTSFSLPSRRARASERPAASSH